MTDDSVQRAPYPGLRAFRREETDLFFGREDCINSMVDRLAATRFLAVLGSSGTGKSSLVRTGLLDALELGLMASAGSRWRIVDFRPGGAPLKNLARRLLETKDPEGGSEPPEDEVDLLRAMLVRGPRSVIEWCRAGHVPKGTNLLLLVDQFEELFRYQDYAGREEAEAFVALLLESARTKDFPIHVAITMRSEYLGACALIEGLADAINAGMFLTPRMTREQCREAIVGPAAVCNIEIEPALINRLLNDLANFAPWDDSDTQDQLDRVMRRADQLPLLQYTLNRMWLRARERSSDERTTLTLADYNAIGGLSGALNAHADQLFDQLGKDRSQIVEWVFRALTAGSTIADAVRRPTRFDELVAVCGGDEAGVRAVVDVFRAPGVNFLIPELDSKHQRLANDAYVDISHESLIRQWKKLSEWLEREARAAQQWRRLIDRFGTGELLRGRELANLIVWRAETKPSAAWAKRYGGDYPAVISFLQHSDRAQTRKRVWMTAAVVAVFVLMGITTLSSVYDKRVAQKSLQEVETAQAGLKQMTTMAERERDRADKALEEANDYIETLIFSITQKTKDAEVNTAMAIAEATLSITRKRVESNAANNDAKRHLTVTLNIYGDVKLRMNAVDDAAKAFEESLKICRELVIADAEKSLWQDDLALALSRVGNIKNRRNELEAAREHYKEATDIDRKLVASNPTERALNNFQLHLGSFGDVLVRLKDNDGALKIFNEQLDVRRRLLRLTPDNTDRQESVSTVLDKIGERLRQAGDTDGARKHFNEALEIDRKLHLRDPKKKEWVINLIWSLVRIGDLDRQLGKLPEALRSYDEALGHERTLLAADQYSAERQRALAALLSKMGDVKKRMKDFVGARYIYEDEIELRRKLVASDKTNAALLRNLATALDNLGNMLRELNDMDGARKAFEEELAIDRGIVARDPEGVPAQVDLAWTLNKVGDFLRGLGDLRGARRLYEDLLTIDRKLAAREPTSKQRYRKLADDFTKYIKLLLQIGDIAAAKRSYDELFLADERWLFVSRQEFAKTDNADNRLGLVQVLGEAAWHGFLSNRPHLAVQYGEEALKLDSSQTWLKVNLAHAYLFASRRDDAKALYVATKDVPKRSDPKKTFVEDIKEDFALFRKLQIAIPDMDWIERELGL